MSDYKTQDIVLASCLKLHGYNLSNIEKVGNKGIFVFVDEEVGKWKTIADFVLEYDLDSISVKPIAFNNTIKQLTTSVRRMLK